MEDRVVGILPALVAKPLIGCALIFDKTVAIGIAASVDPAQRRLDRGPQLSQRLKVAGAFAIEPGEQDEQRRRVDTAVILRERHFAQRRHFAAAHLMQDLSGLRIGKRVDGCRLIISEPPQHAARNARIEPQHLQRRDDAVAAERGGVPGDAGIGISALRRLRHQHVEVGHRTAQHLVEYVVRGLDAGAALGQAAHFTAMRQQAGKESL